MQSGRSQMVADFCIALYFCSAHHGYAFGYGPQTVIFKAVISYRFGVFGTNPVTPGRRADKCFCLFLEFVCVLWAARKMSARCFAPADQG